MHGVQDDRGEGTSDPFHGAVQQERHELVVVLAQHGQEPAARLVVVGVEPLQVLHPNVEHVGVGAGARPDLDHEARGELDRRHGRLALVFRPVVEMRHVPHKLEWCTSLAMLCGKVDRCSGRGAFQVRAAGQRTLRKSSS